MYGVQGRDAGNTHSLLLSNQLGRRSPGPSNMIQLFSISCHCIYSVCSVVMCRVWQR